jgi:hypothetical protein
MPFSKQKDVSMGYGDVKTLDLVASRLIAKVYSEKICAGREKPQRPSPCHRWQGWRAGYASVVRAALRQSEYKAFLISHLVFI